MIQTAMLAYDYDDEVNDMMVVISCLWNAIPLVLNGSRVLAIAIFIKKVT